jgi:hypothetical protein
MLEERQLIRELKLEGVNHDRMRKWVKTCVCARKHIIEIFPSQGRLIPSKEFGQSQERQIFFFQ